MPSAFQIFNAAIVQHINPECLPETLVSDCQFTEGPVWNADGFYLFSDITANTIYALRPGQEKKVFVSYSGTADPSDADLKQEQAGSNGLAYDRRHNLLVCRHGSHEVARWDGRDWLTVAGLFNGRPLNSPNDLVVDEGNRLFFSDPPYGLKEGKLNPEKFQPLAGVYVVDSGELRLICDKYQYPNGLCLSPDGRELYICSNKPFENFVSVYDVKSLAFKRVLAAENSDGMKCDPHGNLWLCTNEGLLVLNAQGQRMALLPLPSTPANCCWGGAGGKDLLVTARQNVFLLRHLLH